MFTVHATSPHSVRNKRWNDKDILPRDVLTVLWTDTQTKQLFLSTAFNIYNWQICCIIYKNYTFCNHIPQSLPPCHDRRAQPEGPQPVTGKSQHRSPKPPPPLEQLSKALVARYCDAIEQRHVTTCAPTALWLIKEVYEQLKFTTASGGWAGCRMRPNSSQVTIKQNSWCILSGECQVFSTLACQEQRKRKHNRIGGKENWTTRKTRNNTCN